MLVGGVKGQIFLTGMPKRPFRPSLIHIGPAMSEKTNEKFTNDDGCQVMEKLT